jgi:hypothetical protein
MSNHRLHVPAADQLDYHEALQEERVRRATRLISPGDVIALVESRLAEESDPTVHPLYPMALFFLDRLTAVDGGKLYDDWRQRILAAIDSLTDDALECLGED